MVSIGFFTTDFTATPAIDPLRTRIEGREVRIPGKKTVVHGGTFWYRGGMQAQELAKHGWDTHVSWQFRVAPDGHIQTMDPNGDWHDPEIFWSQRWMKKDADKMIRRARATGQVCIADLDDAFHALPKSNIAYTTTDPKSNPDFNREHYWKMLAACDLVTTSTEPLRREMDRLGVPSIVLRNAIDLARWHPHDPGENGMIGWIGGIQWRAADLALLRSVGLPEFLGDHGLPMYHGGDSQVPGVPKFWEQVGIDPRRTQCVTMPLCSIQDYPQLWEPLGISLIPLERVRFNESKSWLKQLESCAVGLPYIVSGGFAEQQLLIQEGTAGRVARNDKPVEWQRHLTELLDPDVRRHEGKINRSVAEAHDIAIRWRDWDAAYKESLR